MHAGGTLAVTFWPSQIEEQGPWQRLADLSTNKPKAFTESSHKQSVEVRLCKVALNSCIDRIDLLVSEQNISKGRTLPFLRHAGPPNHAA